MYNHLNRENNASTLLIADAWENFSFSKTDYRRFLSRQLDLCRQRIWKRLQKNGKQNAEKSNIEYNLDDILIEENLGNPVDEEDFNFLLDEENCEENS